ncbi:MAG TPA: integrin alpha [Candidatus Polarisedimenticolia bacterium]|nr:integrin alpha [Candidatus Polarisedimenticolia bacterium]
MILAANGRRLAVLAAAAAAGIAPAAAQFVEPDVSVLYTLTSDQPGDGFGFVAEAIGDLDGDGASEIAIGAPRNSSGGPQAGKVFVHSGRDGSLLHTVAGAPFNRLGHGVTGLGDVDADGVPDYAVSGPGSFGGPFPQLGRVMMISGATHSVLADRSGPSHFSFFGYDIGRAGDVDQDGRPDLIVGAPFHSAAGQFSGSIHLISGRDGSTLRTHPGSGPQVFFGTGVSRVADQDGDGRDEHAVGASGGGTFRTGEAYILSGSDGSIQRVLKAKQQTGFAFGDFFVHDAGDIDADGKGDIYVGDYADANGAGLGYVFYGGRDDRRLFPPESATDGLGPGRGAGDVDGDGHDDLVIAAFTSGAGAPGAGKMFVFSGRNGKVIRTMTGTAAGELLGFDALAVGDVNGDGRIDFLITGTTTAHLILGNP